MNTNVVISLDTRRQKKNGTFPLVLRLGHNERTTPISLGISILEKDWDTEKRVIVKNYSASDSVTRLNNMLAKKRAVAMDIILKLHETNKLQSMSLLEVKRHVAPKNNSGSFFHFTKQIILELRQANRIGYAESHNDVVNVLSNFVNKKELLFQDITYSFLTKFENNHLSKEGNGLNGLAVYMRTIRSLYNKAIKAGIAEKDQYPFDDYKIRTIPTKKRALPADPLRTLINKDIVDSNPLFHTRNFFVASFMMYGMNFTDMAFLKKNLIIDGRILYRRKKTSKLYDIKVTPNLEKLLSYYSGLNADSPYIFPILKRDGDELQFRDIRWARKRHNKKLKALATYCGIEQNLTSYVSRHSFATNARLLNVPLSAISAMLGHSSIKTTEIYLASLPTDLLDNYNASYS